MNNKKYFIRPIKIEDFVELEKWWRSYENKGQYVPKRNLLPNNGLGGCVVEKENKIIACAFLYLTNSDLGYIDYLIADPLYREDDREYMLLKLAVYTTEVAKKNGCETVWAMTKNKKLLKMADKAGFFEISKEDFKVVYFINNDY